MIKIPFNVPSSKNSKIWTGRRLISSKPTQNYIKNTYLVWQNNKDAFLKELEGKEKPYKIELYFVRDSKRRFDYINAAQVIFDLMQEHGYIEDDNTDNVIPVFRGYHLDKENCGVEIRVL